MNQEIGSAIWARLKSGTALTALLYGGTATGSASIFVDHAGDDAGLPYVIIGQQSGQWAYTMGENARFQSSLWQVRAVSGKAFPKEAEAIDSQIDSRLHNVSLSIGGYATLRVVRESDVRFPEVDGGQTIQNVGALYRVDVQKT